MAIAVMERPLPAPLRVVRCANCHEPLFHARGLADIEIVCHRRGCKHWQRVRLQDGAGRDAAR